MHFPAPGDYQPLNVVASIPAGGIQHFVEIPIGVDYDIEDTESFEVVLSSPSEDAVIAQTVATINIIDVDSKSCFVCLKLLAINSTVCIAILHAAKIISRFSIASYPGLPMFQHCIIFCMKC